MRVSAQLEWMLLGVNSASTRKFGGWDTRGGESSPSFGAKMFGGEDAGAFVKGRVR